MLPFKERSVNPFYQVNGVRPTQLYGLNYEENYNYKYDDLRFDGKTPEEFHLHNSCTNSRLAGIVMKDQSRRTTNQIRMVKTDDNTTIATIPHAFPTLGDVRRSSQKMFDFDLTPTLTDSSKGLQTNKIHLEVVSSDEKGHSIPAIAFKPTFDYIDPEGRRMIKVHVDYFKDYAPVVKFCDLDSSVEFLNSDGSYSDQVKRKVKQGKTTDAISPVKLTSMTNEFIFKNHQIEFDHDPLCHINLLQPRRRSGWGTECLPTERDPCHTAGCVKVVPWSGGYLEEHSNTVRTNLTVMVAWCGTLEADIYELQTESDFNNCENFPEDPMSYPRRLRRNQVDGFIVTGPGHRYFASKKCQDGVKVKIDFF